METFDTTSEQYKITEIYWERIFLHIVVTVADEAKAPTKFVLRRFSQSHEKVPREVYNQTMHVVEDPMMEKVVNGQVTMVKRTPNKRVVVNTIKEETDVLFEKKEDGRFDCMISMPAANGRSFLNNGNWQIVAILPEDEEHICSLDYKVAEKKEDLSRVFRYNNNHMAYTLTFDFYNSKDGMLSFLMRSHFMIDNNKWAKYHSLAEAMTFKGKRKKLRHRFVCALINSYYHFVRFFAPKKGNRILFMTETKNYLWGNLKAVYDRVNERGLGEDYVISTSTRIAVGKHQSVRSWIKTVTLIAKQDVIFVDDFVPIFEQFHLDPKTRLVQLWHAGEGFKAVGFCRFGKKGSPFPAGTCHKEYTNVITASKKLIHVFEEVFGIERSAFLPYGMPRLDGFLDENKIAQFKESFYAEHPDLKGKKVILFAPTYRGTGQKSAYYPYDELDLSQIYDYCGEDKVFLFKMHPFVTKKPKIPEEYKDRIQDISSYPSINDLYYITDLLITDYSSAFFEYALMKRPVLFFTYDRERYELTRGVHRPVKETAPGKVCDSFDEMMKALREEDFEAEKIEQFVKDNFGEYDGHASDRIIDNIILGKGQLK